MLEESLHSAQLTTFSSLARSGESLLVEGLWDTPKALLSVLARLATGKHLLILTGGIRESRLYDDLFAFHTGTILEFPSWETLPSEEIPPSVDIVGERYQVLREILRDEKPKVVLASLQAVLQRVLPPAAFRTLDLSLSVGEEVPFSTFVAQLGAMGYIRAPLASDKGQFAVRGGIVDLFPVSSTDPFRIEFCGDEIESIRVYDPVGQTSVRQVREVAIPPAQELELLERHQTLATLLDYLGKETLIIFDDLVAIEDRYASIKKMLETVPRSFQTFEDFLQAAGPLQKLFLPTEPIESLSEVRRGKKEGAVAFSAFGHDFEAVRWRSPFLMVSQYFQMPEDPLAEAKGTDLLLAIGQYSDDPLRLDFLCSTDSEEQHLHAQLDTLGITLPKASYFKKGYLSSGFVIGDIPYAVIPLTEITHRYKIRRKKMRSTYHTTPVEAFSLEGGDFVVHLNHGVGKYLGITHRPDHNGIDTEYLQLEYAEKSQLYVPLNQAHLVTKYVGGSEESPRLHIIGGPQWKRAKRQTETAIMGYAADLLRLYAERAAHSGFTYAEDSPLLKQLELDFPYEETDDQLSAIAAIKGDMVSPRPMDRLICGDVGYGKTEVAMRAAAKAVIDGNKQVAVLVPTTVLAMQHYDTFCERMASYPIRIGVLSRFKTAKEIKETLKGVAEGTVDILIGTHRIVSEDVTFKNLGLVIVDEEQRFGVRAKEHLKKIQQGVDSLTLSATPIPRTLYMSLVGARDMSVINTPPQDRLPIKTIICESHDTIIKNALLRELARDGQAFVIHNRVESIDRFAEKIRSLVPDSRIVIGHGQMGADALDTVFHQFKSGKANILVATSIVENGVDIPNANTILIDRADCFGLAELYQLRGRVGRWNRSAYAYFMTPQNRMLNETAHKRLGAMRQAGGYGGGMKIAMFDLEIRGAGNILGTEQSGFVSSVGFHLYCKMLKRAVDTLQGKTSSFLTDTKMEFPYDARIPEAYVAEMSLRMEIYQRFGEAVFKEEVDKIWSEVRDRYGPPPLSMLWLYHLSRVRVFASQHHFILLKLKGVSVTAEQKKGETTTTNGFIIGHIKTPEELEAKVIAGLQKHFKL